MVIVLDGNSEVGYPRKEHSLSFDLFQGFDYIKGSHISDFYSTIAIFFFMTAENELPSNISTLVETLSFLENN